MIRLGDNTVRIYAFRNGRSGIYDVYQFGVINLDGKTAGFCYKVPAGTVVLPRIVRDLLELKRLDFWFTVYLKEHNGLLTIFTIKEPKLAQSEYWHLAKKVA